MARRKTVYVLKDTGAPKPGTSPNAYVPRVTAEIRVHYPPYPENLPAARAALTDAYFDALTAFDAQIEQQES